VQHKENRGGGQMPAAVFKASGWNATKDRFRQKNNKEYPCKTSWNK
jgi:hypothetical protein